MAEPEKRPAWRGEAQRRRVGRPRGPETAIVNLRIPVDLLARLDRYIDRQTVRTGDTGINRATVMREALTAWLEAKGF